MEIIKTAIAIIEETISSLLAIKGFRGTVRITVHVNSDEKSVKVVPDIIPNV